MIILKGIGENIFDGHNEERTPFSFFGPSTFTSTTKFLHMGILTRINHFHHKKSNEHNAQAK